MGVCQRTSHIFQIRILDAVIVEGTHQLRLTRAVLVDIRNRCVDKRVWFGTLSHLERSVMNLTITLVDEVKSSRLAEVLTGIVSRLQDALQSVFLAKARREGLIIAKKMAEIAYSWGNRGALAWIDDKGYVLFLGISSINNSNRFGRIV